MLHLVNGQSTKTSVPYQEIIKDYNSGMVAVDLLDQKTAAYRLDRNSSGGGYYLRLFFDLRDMCMVNWHIYSGFIQLYSYTFIDLYSLYRIRTTSAAIYRVHTRQMHVLLC